MILQKADIKAVLTGASFYSTGGGGTVEDGMKLLKTVKQIKIIKPDQAKKNSICATSFFAGSISAPSLKLLKEKNKEVKIKNEGELLINSFNSLEKAINKKIDYLIPIELGGHNTAVIFYLSAKLDIPVLDGDLTGRSAPEMYQTTYFLGDIPPSPSAISNIFKEDIIITGVNNYKRLDDMLRFLVENSIGFDVGVSTFPIKVKEALPFLIKNSLSSAKKVGELLLKGEIEKALSFTKAKIIFKGKVKAEKYKVENGFTIGEIIVENKKEKLMLKYKNEILAAYKDGNIIEKAPNLIGVINEDGIPILNTHFKTGENIIVYKIKAPSIWRSKKGRKIFGLDHFKIS